MKYLASTFPDPESNLACDEALLEHCENIGGSGILRIWEPANYFVVVGYSNTISSEVNLPACEMKNIAVFRRFSGGGSVLQGPGCLNFSLIIENEQGDSMAHIAGLYQLVLRRHQRVLKNIIRADVELQGFSDLAVDGRKFSGNAQHRKKRCALIHGTFLLNFDLSMIEACLRMPSRQPQYRRNRPHKDFLLNLHVDPETLRQALRREWNAVEDFAAVPDDRIKSLVAERYRQKSWNFKL